MIFTQLFGNYLLNNKLIAKDDLKLALEHQTTVHVKLGIMAVNSGFMSAEQVTTVHTAQIKVDKKFGELAIELGYLDDEKLKILLSAQKPGHLVLGQAMVDMNLMTLEEFQDALINYKKDTSLSVEQFNALQSGDIDEMINSFYAFNNSTESLLYKSYLSLLVKNFVRFIDSDFVPQEVEAITEVKTQWLAGQSITGEQNIYTYIEADDRTFINFAGLYAEENYTEINDYVKSSVGEFLNQVNGLFIVNKSDENIELELTPQVVSYGQKLTELSEGYCIPIAFYFGVVRIIVSKTKPITI